MFVQKMLRPILASGVAIITLSACGTDTEQSTTNSGQATVPNTAYDTVFKSSLDKREYAYRELTNGLKLIVVSDPDADKAAASLDVHIGHLADPPKREGLSHFLEHMLFLGTKKYPEVGEYQKFISKHGGSNNAGTGMEHTSYFFQIDNDYLEPALDRFSRFFVDPLFDPEYLEKERNAVHSEYSLKVKDDGRRYREAVKQTANQAHPMTQFSVGNLSTLSNTPNSTIYDAVVAHYKKYYSADIMTLSIVGDYPVEKLMLWAEEKFSQIPSKGDARKLDRPEPYRTDQLGVKIMVNTLEDKRTLRLNFALPSADPNFESKPLSYITHLLGHEGEGTLYDVLKTKNYLKNMYVSTWGPDEFTRLTVHFDLTNEGYVHTEDIANYFFSYVEKIRQEGISESAYKELANINQLSFEYQDKSSVASFAGRITNNLHYFPPNHALDVRRVYEKYDPDLIQSFLNKIHPENVRMILSSPDFDGNQKEERYDVAYNMHPLDPALLARWAEGSKMAEVGLPKPNPYIAEDISAKNTKAISSPKIAFSKEGIKIWYVNENEFKLPKSSLNFRLYMPVAYESMGHNMALSLHTRIVQDLLNAVAYPAAKAGLYYGVNKNNRSYSIGVQGYNDKIDVFLGELLKQLDVHQVTEEIFDRIKSNYQQDIRNRSFSRPISQVFGAFVKERDAHAIDDDEALELLEDMTLEHFKNLIGELHSKIQIEGIYNGNVSKEDVKNIGQILRAKFKEQLVGNGKLPVPQIEINESSKIPVREVEVDHNDSSIVWMFKADNDKIHTRAKAQLIRQILGSRFYKSLRTDQQYGYVVGMTSSEYAKMPYTGFYIQSPKAHPSILKIKIKEFMDSEVEYLETVSDEEFQSHVDGLLSNINKTYDNVYVKGNSLHSEVISENLEFDTRNDLTIAVNALSKADMLEFFKKEFLSDNTRSYIAWNIGKAHKDTPEYDATNYDICHEKHCLYSRFK